MTGARSCTHAHACTISCITSTRQHTHTHTHNTHTQRAHTPTVFSHVMKRHLIIVAPTLTYAHHPSTLACCVCSAFVGRSNRCQSQGVSRAHTGRAHTLVLARAQGAAVSRLRQRRVRVEHLPGQRCDCCIRQYVCSLQCAYVHVTVLLSFVSLRLTSEPLQEITTIFLSVDSKFFSH